MYNDIVTGKIPVSGEGFHKTYEESIIRRIDCRRNYSMFNSYKNELFMDVDGEIYWASDEYEYENLSNDSSYKKVVILNVKVLDSEIYLIEVIDPKVLRLHLLHEEKYKMDALAKSENEELRLL